MATDLERLRATVQHNCDICDARHAGDLTLCTYLMKMRELYRWEKGYPYGAALPNRAVGEWVRERERRWRELEDASYEPLPVDGGEVDPFESEAANEALVPEGLVYSGGYGRGMRPHFFLGRLARRHEIDGCTVLVSDHEYARDLQAPPAMSQGRTVFLRKAALRQLLWERIEAWRFSRCPDNAMGRAAACYPLERDTEGALERMAEDQLETVLLHEIGEVRAGRILGKGWERMLADVAGGRAELLARAVRDNLADCLSTLPALLEDPQPARLHFLMASMAGLRGEIFPALREAYERWHAGGGTAGLRRALEAGTEHWSRIGRRMLELHAAGELLRPARLDALVAEAQL